MKNELYKKYILNFQINLLDCKLLGKGHNGVVYMLPEGKVIKICFNDKSCQKEYSILSKVNNNKYFPRTYGMCGNYMIRDFVDGITLNHHIKQYGMDRNLAIKIIDLIHEFKKLKFSKEDIRCKDIMVRPDGSLMVIDPKKCYSQKRDFPRHLSKGLYKLGVLDYFMSIVKEEEPRLYMQWHGKITEYIDEKKDEFGYRRKYT